MKFQTQLTAKELFRFSLIYTYSGLSGIMAIFVIAMGGLMIYRTIGLKENVTYLFLGAALILLFVVINPFMLYMKAKKQVLSNPAYHVPTYYTLNEDGILVEIKDEKGTIEWWRIIKVKHQLGLYIFYTGRQQAFVFPESAMGDKKDEIMDFVLAHTKTAKKPSRKAKTEVEASISKYTKQEKDEDQEENS